MQVPEKLSLIGGSILLASTLVFTLKSQASNILPKVDSGVSSLVNADKSGQSSNDSPQNQQAQQKQQQEQADQTFNNNFQQAQQKGWQTGQWGSSKYYIDSGNNLHVGGGQLQGALEDILGHDKLTQIKAINLDGQIQAPQDSQNLFGLEIGSGSNAINQINGLDKLDTSQVTNMEDMFAYNSGSFSNLDLSHFDTHNVNNMSNMFENDGSLSNLDLSHFDTHNVTNMDDMFEADSSLSNLDISRFDTHNVNNMYSMFEYDGSLSNLDLSHFDTSNVTDTGYMFEGTNIHQLSLGSNIKLQNNPSNNNYNSYLRGTYQNNGQTLNLDGNAHPGTWIRQ